MTSVSSDRRIGVNSGAAIKVPCKAASTAALTLSGEQTIDGVALVTGDRVLVKNQASGVDNGIYVVDTGAWSRAVDFDAAYDVVQGTIVMVTGGTSNVNTYWRISTANPITIGTTALTFASALGSDAALMSFLQAGTGAVTRTSQAKMREVFSVTDFGAIGDGATDDTAAIRLCIAASAAVTDGARPAVFFPPGNYKVTDTITLPDAHMLLVGGTSSGGARITSTIAAADLFYNASNGGKQYEFQDLLLVGVGAGSGNGIRITDTNTGVILRMRNVGITNFQGNGYSGLYCYNVYWGALDNVKINTCYRGVWLTHQCNGWMIRNLRITGTTDSAFKMSDTCTTFSWIGGEVENNDGHGIWFNGVQDFLLAGLHIEANNSSVGGYNSIWFDGTNGSGAYNSSNGGTVLQCHFSESTCSIVQGGIGGYTTAITYINSSMAIVIGNESYDYVKVLSGINPVTGGAQALATLVCDQPGGYQKMAWIDDGAGGGVDRWNILVPSNNGVSNYTCTLVDDGKIYTQSAVPTDWIGRQITLKILQDAVGGFNVTWDATFKQAWSDAGNTAGKFSTITFLWDGTQWNQVGAQSPYI